MPCVICKKFNGDMGKCEQSGNPRQPMDNCNIDAYDEDTTLKPEINIEISPPGQPPKPAVIKAVKKKLEKKDETKAATKPNIRKAKLGKPVKDVKTAAKKKK